MEDVAQLAEYLPSMHKVLGSIPNTYKLGNGGIWSPSTQQGEAGGLKVTCCETLEQTV